MKRYFVSTVVFEVDCKTDEDAKNVCERVEKEIVTDGPSHYRGVLDDYNMDIMHVCVLEYKDAKVDVCIPDQEKAVEEENRSLVEQVKLAMQKVTNAEMKWKTL
jgi:hypothetical protein